jgi:hypothetical protein
MSVLFVYRSHYEGPTGKYVRQFEDKSILDWFRDRWRGAQGDDAFEVARTALGTDVYGFDSLFRAIAELGLKPPRSDAELREQLEKHLYVEGEILHSPHCIQVLTDDDEIELAYYFCDDVFRAEHATKAAFLLHEGVGLPATAGESGYKPRVETKFLDRKGGEGSVYMAFLAYYDSSNLDLAGGYRIDGIRLPELRDHLTSVKPTGAWPFELRLLRSRLDGGLSLAQGLGDCTSFPVAVVCNRINTSKIGLGHLRAAVDELDALRTDSRLARSAHDPSKSLVQAERHVAQLCLHTDRWDNRDLYHRWILFDDLWAATHADLAEAILRYATRWDVLS